MSNLQETVANLANEETPVGASLAEDNEFASGGAWPNGPYPGVILAETTFPSGAVARTEDVPSENNPEKRNLTIVTQITNPEGKQRTVLFRLSYRPTDITNYADRKAFVKTVAQRNEGAQRWDDTDAQATQITYQTLKSMQKGLEGFAPTTNGNGGFSVTGLISQAGTVNVGTDKKGFNKVNSFRGFKRQ